MHSNLHLSILKRSLDHELRIKSDSLSDVNIVFRKYDKETPLPTPSYKKNNWMKENKPGVNI